MASTIDRATLDRLVALGRAKGGLTARELQEALPVEAMDVDALVLVMLELEEAGVSVEPDAVGPRTGPVPAAGFVLPVPDPGTPAPAARPGDGGRPADDRPRPRPAPVPGRSGGAEPDAAVGRVVLLCGLAVLIVLGTILVLI